VGNFECSKKGCGLKLHFEHSSFQRISIWELNDSYGVGQRFANNVSIKKNRKMLNPKSKMGTFWTHLYGKK
jgi:hypothetical protein